MQEQSRKLIKEVISSNIKAIKSEEPKNALAKNPELRVIDKEYNKLRINLLLTRLREQHKELLPYVHKIKPTIVDITETTYACAIYLLMCSIFDNWNSFFLLAKNGRSSAAGALIRMIKEGVMQVQLFALESTTGSRANLDKWFSGEIIQHATGREGMEKHWGKYLPFPDVNAKDLDAHIYQIESQASHNGYVTILELVSPFTEDYDFDDFSGYYRILGHLRYALGSMASTNIALRIAYSNVVKDHDAWEKLDEILIKYNPEMEGE